jgi:RNA polymerase sigma-70 factor (ECF subfamily)
LDYSSAPDEVLVKLMVQGRTEALGVLYDRYSRLVFSLAWHIVRDQAAAEEITQDVFYRVWENAATYRPEQARLTTWMTSITRYRAIDALRQRGTRPQQENPGWAEVALARLPAAGDGPEEAAALALERQRVRAAIATLPREQQEALALAFFQGLSHSQIAEALHQPLGTVKTRIRLAMQKLRELMGEDDELHGEIQ